MSFFNRIIFLPVIMFSHSPPMAGCGFIVRIHQFTFYLQFAVTKFHTSCYNDLEYTYRNIVCLYQGGKAVQRSINYTAAKLSLLHNNYSIIYPETVTLPVSELRRYSNLHSSGRTIHYRYWE